MELPTTNLEAEISKLTSLRNMNDGQITKTIKHLDVLKANQLQVVTKLKSLQAAKTNISKFNKAG